MLSHKRSRHATSAPHSLLTLPTPATPSLLHLPSRFRRFPHYQPFPLFPLLLPSPLPLVNQAFRPSQSRSCKSSLQQSPSTALRHLTCGSACSPCQGWRQQWRSRGRGLPVRRVKGRRCTARWVVSGFFLVVVFSYVMHRCVVRFIALRGTSDT